MERRKIVIEVKTINIDNFWEHRPQQLVQLEEYYKMYCNNYFVVW